MPIYTYLCDYCGHEFDEIVRSSDPEETVRFACRCGSQATRIPSRSSTPRGSFGTVRRNTSREKIQTFNFNPTKETGTPDENKES